MPDDPKGFIGRGIDYLKSLIAPKEAAPQTMASARAKQGPGFYQADIGLETGGKSNEPAHGKYKHNSPAKPL